MGACDVNRLHGFLMVRLASRGRGKKTAITALQSP